MGVSRFPGSHETKIGRKKQPVVRVRVSVVSVCVCLPPPQVGLSGRGGGNKGGSSTIDLNKYSYRTFSADYVERSLLFI